MYQWYKGAKVCFAYLEDVPSDTKLNATDSSFARSRWYTRGWTLQELLAPSLVKFFAEDWTYLGAKDGLKSMIGIITGIPWKYLSGSHYEASVAQRMSWASRRATTRREDMAYCLLGLFDVNLPLLYGEGDKAFRRLQEEILKNSADHSLFAWGIHRFGVGEEAAIATGITPRKESEPEPEPTPPNRNELEWRDSNWHLRDTSLIRDGHVIQATALARQRDYQLENRRSSMLAHHPADFANSGSIVPYQSSITPCTMTGRGIQMELVITTTQHPHPDWLLYAILPCHPDRDTYGEIAVPVERITGDDYCRLSNESLVPLGTKTLRLASKGVERPLRLQKEFVYLMTSSTLFSPLSTTHKRNQRRLVFRKLPDEEDWQWIREIWPPFSKRRLSSYKTIDFDFAKLKVAMIVRPEYLPAILNSPKQPSTSLQNRELFIYLGSKPVVLHGVGWEWSPHCIISWSDKSSTDPFNLSKLVPLARAFDFNANTSMEEVITEIQSLNYVSWRIKVVGDAEIVIKLYHEPNLVGCDWYWRSIELDLVDGQNGKEIDGSLVRKR